LLVIAHRGNLQGRKEHLENNPEYILQAINQGFETEVDVWYVNNAWYLGHDFPQYEVGFNYFVPQMWIHCKNLEAVEQLTNSHLNWFWHETDKITQTSKGYLWCYPEVYVEDAIVVVLGLPHKLPKNLKGVCTDYALKWRDK